MHYVTTLTLMLVAAAAAGSSLSEDFERIKQSVVGKTFREAQALFDESALRHKATTFAPDAETKIEHMVVLLVENRAFDHVFGCMLGDEPGVDGVKTRADGSQWALFPKEMGTGEFMLR